MSKDLLTLELTEDEAAMLVRGYIDGIPGGNVAVHQALTTKLERIKYNISGLRAVTSSWSIRRGKEAIRV